MRSENEIKAMLDRVDSDLEVDDADYNNELEAISIAFQWVLDPDRDNAIITDYLS